MSSPTATVDRTTQIDFGELDARHRVNAASGARSVEIEVEHLGEPVRFARVASAIAGPTCAALVQASVDGRVVYPASPEQAPTGQRVRLRFRTRHGDAVIDDGVTERLVRELSGHGIVVGVQRTP